MTFKDALKEDLGVFIGADEFDVSATVHNKEIKILFDLEKDDNSGALLMPVIHAKTEDVQPLSKGLLFDVDGCIYAVLDWYDLDGITVMSCNEEQF